MNMKNTLTRMKIFFNPSREEFIVTLCLLFFFPLPSYFVAGKGVIPPFFTLVVVIAYVLPFISGTSLLVLLYIGVLPFISYLGALAACRTVRNKRLLWGMAAALVLIGCLAPVYFIIDNTGMWHVYNAIKLYGELF
jgi:hypothetical protein